MSDKKLVELIEEYAFQVLDKGGLVTNDFTIDVLNAKQAIIDYAENEKKLYLRLILPFKLPTWNNLLAMNRFERAKLNKWIKNTVSTFLIKESDSQTLRGLVLRLPLTELSKLEYSEMIQPNTYKKYRLRKKNARLAKKKKL